ncbi:MAG: PstS family phosphate ABC transporter substrate-binding protein [Pirellulales bacterium]
MSLVSRKFFFGAALSGLAILIGCSPKTAPTGGSGSGAAASGGASAAVIQVDGSSTVFPVAEAVAEEYETETNNRVTVGRSGTGGGFKKFLRGEIDICNASRPILTDEIKGAKDAGIEYLELPICFDALTVAVNPKATWVDNITVEELKKIWEPAAQGKITKWNQIRPNWPDKEFALFGAGSDSGTFDYFTEAVCGKSKSSRGDFTASEDDNTLVTGIEGNEFALGYIPYSYYEANKAKLKALPIDWEKDKLGPIAPSAESVVSGQYNPLSRPLFIYVNKKSLDRPEVKAFVDYYLNNVAKLAAEVKYLPLPPKAYDMVKERVAKLKVGTGFSGAPEVGLPVEDILKREPK